MKKQYKALSLLSGGLDSQLAICVMRDQGIHVEAITYRSPFFGSANGEKAAKAIGVAHHIVDFTEDILEQVQNPVHGLGGAMNPCIDCHTRMIMRAGELMEQWNFDFIATGEVLSQRPMSQTRHSLGIVARGSKYEDVLVRPLSAALLPPTKPVREGWIDVNKLPRFSGRSRSPQMELARYFGLSDYPTPAGGCLLTEKRFVKKLKDLLDKEGPDSHRTNVWLLKTGRHMRLSDEVKIIVGSCHEDNKLLETRAHPEDLRITCPDLPSPTTIAPSGISEELLRLAASICARYAKTPDSGAVKVAVSKGAQTRDMYVEPLDSELVKQYMIAH